MGWLTDLVKVGTKVATSGLGGSLLKGVPILGTALTAYGAYQAVKGAFSGPTAGGAPMPVPMPGTTGGLGIPRGPGGAMQMPWSDPSISTAQKPHALDDSYLRKSYRAPHGYVVGYDPQGRPFALEKSWAKSNAYYDAHGRMKKFHPANKPPVSVGQYHALKKSHHTIKAFHKIFKTVAFVAHNTTKDGHVKQHAHKHK